MLPASTIEAIQSRIAAGDEALDADEFRLAIETYLAAVAMIPEPRHRHEISLEAFTALGEGYYFSGRYELAVEAFKQAQKAPGGVEHPLVYLRLGQAYFECAEFDLAADALTRAYALAGPDVYEGEDPRYLTFLATRIDLEGGGTPGP